MRLNFSFGEKEISPFQIVTPGKTAPSAVLFWICAFLIFVSAWFYSWRHASDRYYIIEGDGKGFYRYLQSIFIENNFTRQKPDSRFIIEFSGRGVNKYFAGTAILLAPFFFSACAYCFLTGSPIDGASQPFQFFTGLAAMFYCVVGLFFVRKILLHLKFSEIETATTIFLLAFGTNLFTYVAIEPSMSHIYSFAAMACFFYMVVCGTGRRDLFLAALALGLVVLIRPVNIVCLTALPFLCDSFYKLRERIIHLSGGKKALMIAVIIFLAVVFIQPLLWYLQSGKFFVWGYKDEGFYFLKPHLYDILFGFRKGFFIYTPLFFFAVIFFVVQLRKITHEALLFFLFFIPAIYVTSSWWNWYYGDSFGMRPLVDYYSVLVIPVAYTVHFGMHSKAKLFFAIPAMAFLAFNQLQNYQYKNGMLSADGMNYEKYKYSFMNFSPGCFGGNEDIPPYPENKLEEIFITVNDYEKEYAGWSSDTIIFNKEINSHVCDYSGREFCTLYQVTGNDLSMYRRYFLTTSFEINFANPIQCSEARFAVEYKNKGDSLMYYYTFRINELRVTEPGKWREKKYTLDLPPLNSPGDAIRIYLWNPQEESFLLDNFSLQFSGIKRHQDF